MFIEQKKQDQKNFPREVEDAVLNAGHRTATSGLSFLSWSRIAVRPRSYLDKELRSLWYIATPFPDERGDREATTTIGRSAALSGLARGNKTLEAQIAAFAQLLSISIDSNFLLHNLTELRAYAEAWPDPNTEASSLSLNCL